MKTLIKSVVMLCLGLFLSAGCDSEDAGQETGVLAMKLTVGGNDADESARLVKRAARNAIPIIDLKNIVYEMAVSTGDVTEGAIDDLEWHVIHVGDQMKYQSELDLTYELPVGVYKAFRIVMSNDLYWVCQIGDDVIELGDSNGGASDTVVNIFSVAGLFDKDQGGRFTLQNQNEKIGSQFEILPGRTTTVTLRSNFFTLDWDDTDDSGTWSTGDSLSNWTTVPGTDTMADFIVNYEQD